MQYSSQEHAVPGSLSCEVVDSWDDLQERGFAQCCHHCAVALATYHMGNSRSDWSWDWSLPPGERAMLTWAPAKSTTDSTLYFKCQSLYTEGIQQKTVWSNLMYSIMYTTETQHIVIVTIVSIINAGSVGCSPCCRHHNTNLWSELKDLTSFRLLRKRKHA